MADNFNDRIQIDDASGRILIPMQTTSADSEAWKALKAQDKYKDYQVQQYDYTGNYGVQAPVSNPAGTEATAPTVAQSQAAQAARAATKSTAVTPEIYNQAVANTPMTTPATPSVAGTSPTVSTMSTSSVPSVSGTSSTPSTIGTSVANTTPAPAVSQQATAPAPSLASTQTPVTTPATSPANTGSVVTDPTAVINQAFDQYDSAKTMEQAIASLPSETDLYEKAKSVVGISEGLPNIMGALKYTQDSLGLTAQQATDVFNTVIANKGAGNMTAVDVLTEAGRVKGTNLTTPQLEAAFKNKGYSDVVSAVNDADLLNLASSQYAPVDRTNQLPALIDDANNLFKVSDEFSNTSVTDKLSELFTKYDMTPFDIEGVTSSAYNKYQPAAVEYSKIIQEADEKFGTLTAFDSLAKTKEAQQLFAMPQLDVATVVKDAQDLFKIPVTLTEEQKASVDAYVSQNKDLLKGAFDQQEQNFLGQLSKTGLSDAGGRGLALYDKYVSDPIRTTLKELAINKSESLLSTGTQEALNNRAKFYQSAVDSLVVKQAQVDQLQKSVISTAKEQNDYRNQKITELKNASVKEAEQIVSNANSMKEELRKSFVQARATAFDETKAKQIALQEQEMNDWLDAKTSAEQEAAQKKSIYIDAMMKKWEQQDADQNNQKLAYFDYLKTTMDEKKSEIANKVQAEYESLSGQKNATIDQRVKQVEAQRTVFLEKALSEGVVQVTNPDGSNSYRSLTPIESASYQAELAQQTKLIELRQVMPGVSDSELKRLLSITEAGSLNAIQSIQDIYETKMGDVSSHPEKYPSTVRKDIQTTYNKLIAKLAATGGAITDDVQKLIDELSAYKRYE